MGLKGYIKRTLKSGIDWTRYNFSKPGSPVDGDVWIEDVGGIHYMRIKQNGKVKNFAVSLSQSLVASGTATIGAGANVAISLGTGNNNLDFVWLPKIVPTDSNTRVFYNKFSGVEIEFLIQEWNDGTAYLNIYNNYTVSKTVNYRVHRLYIFY